MKRLLLSIFSLSCFSLIAQGQQTELWGTTQAGGAGDGGVIFSMNPNGTGYQVRHQFGTYNTGILPAFPPIAGSSGMSHLHFGVTTQGGRYNLGVIYSFNDIEFTFTILHEFNYEEGYSPLGGLILYNNKLYGTASMFNGSANKPGVIYEFDLATNTYTIKKTFTAYLGPIPGGTPWGTLLLHNNKIYGTTYTGGSSQAGVLFSYDLQTDNYAALFQFNFSGGGYPNGRSPNGSLSLYNNELYGTTQRGGSFNNGVVFKYNLTTNTYTKLADFGTTGTAGSQPSDGLSFYSDKFYGTATFGGTLGGGTLFSFDPVTNTLTDLQQFSAGGTNGSNPKFKLTLFNNYFYGSAINSNTSANIFGYNPANNTLTSLTSLTANEGALTGDFSIDNITLVTVTDRNLLVIFNTQDNSYQTFEFNSILDGASPMQQLLYANNLLYGSTSAGGNNGYGVVFSFNPSNNTYTVLHHLTDRAYSLGDFTLLNNKLYAPAHNGMLNGSVSQNYGAVYYLDISTKIAGYVPVNPLVQGANPIGRMVPGTNSDELLLLTTIGPGNSSGGLNRFVTSTNTFLPNPWTYGNGSYPKYTTKASNGLVYVATQAGGSSNQGSINRYNSGVVSSFSASTTGRGPTGALTELNDKFYIATNFDGPGSQPKGSITELNPAGMNPPLLKYSLTQNGGTNPAGNMVAFSGSLYGVMNGGGAPFVNSSGESMLLNRGTIFKYDPVANVYTVLHSFNGANGRNPGSLIGALTDGTVPLKFLSFTAKKCADYAVCLNWKTENEINVSHFELQKSSDGRNFIAIKKVSAKNQFSNLYNAEDEIGQATTGRLYYRVKQVDHNGKSSFSTIATVQTNMQGVEVYPTISSNQFNFRNNHPSTKSVRLELLTADGKLLLKQTLSPGINTISTASFAANILYYRILDNRGVQQSGKLIKK